MNALDTLAHESPEQVAAQEALQRILVRSATDMEFRQRLLANPRSAFAEYGHELPAGMDIRFIENRHDATIVLPDPIDAVIELSEMELAEINGGGTPGLVLSIARISSERCAGAIISASAVLIGYIVA